jgi:hypothetical protein
MRVKTVCVDDVVVVDLVARRIVLSVKDEFKTDGQGAAFALRENRFLMATANKLYSVRY